MRMSVGWSWLVVLALASVPVGCGGDEGGDTPAAAGSGGQAGAAGKGGASGAGQAGVGGSVAGSGGASGSSGGLPDVCKSDAECKGFKCCNSECVDTRVDALNCGACGTKCPGAEQQQGLCSNSACTACPMGQADCNALALDGCETNLATDLKNCGVCGKACLLANAQESTCTTGQCQIKGCKAGFQDCDKKADNGCEIDTSTDPLNCGGCGTACPVAANATSTCELGKCGKFVCKTGYADCDGKPENGCEVNLLADLAHCGACNAACDELPHGTVACNDGVCEIGSCEQGFDNCDGSTGNGCETDLAIDVNHCGACGQACSAQTNSDAKCVEGMCGTGTCNPGYADCDPAALGCEVNLSTSKDNCGVCGNACPPVLNGTPRCDLFVCGIDTCNDGFKHCIGGEENGCETDILSDENNCGDCSQVCPPVANGTGKCSVGQCVVASCKGNFNDCDLKADNGCETDVLSAKEHCGFCNNPCPDPKNAVGQCKDGLCGIASCADGFGNCDGKDANGCELPTTIDPKNCGGCGIVCGSGLCDAGKCICTKKVLLIIDDSPGGAVPLITAMQNLGLTVDIARENGVDATPVWAYQGIPNPIDNYGAVVVLAGGPTVNPSTNAAVSDMPAAGQQVLVDFIKASNGVVFTEWAAQHVASGRWQTLKDYVLLERTVSVGGLLTYQIDPAFAAHPIWENLPPSFTFSSTSNVGLVRLGNGNKRIASSPEALDVVAIRDEPKQGRVAHIAHAGSYNDNGWNNENIARLVANAANWSARCK